jgi:hypothetical protein
LRWPPGRAGSSILEFLGAIWIKYLLPTLGRLAASDVTPADVARVPDELKGRTPTAANDLLRFTRRIFASGVRRRLVRSRKRAMHFGSERSAPGISPSGRKRPRGRKCLE